MAHHWSMNMTIISMRGRYSEWSCPNRNVTTRVPVTGRHCRQGDTRITHGKKKSWEQFGWQIDDEYSLLLPYPRPVLPTRGNVLTQLLVTGERRERLRPGPDIWWCGLWAEAGGHRPVGDQHLVAAALSSVSPLAQCTPPRLMLDRTDIVQHGGV